VVAKVGEAWGKIKFHSCPKSHYHACNTWGAIVCKQRALGAKSTDFSDPTSSTAFFTRLSLYYLPVRVEQVVDVILLVVQQTSRSTPSVYRGFSPQWPFPHTLHTGGCKYGSPTFQVKASMGFSHLGVSLNTVEWYNQALDIVALASFAGYTV
jgi:hypothetical protein